jgi:hypothetical protein
MNLVLGNFMTVERLNKSIFVETCFCEQAPPAKILKTEVENA